MGSSGINTETGVGATPADQRGLFRTRDIKKAVSIYFNVTADELCSSSRHAVHAGPRQVAMWLCRKYTKLSLPEIGRKFGGRDHTTALHSIRKIEAKDALYKQENPKNAAKNEELRRAARMLEEQLLSGRIFEPPATESGNQPAEEGAPLPRLPGAAAAQQVKKKNHAGLKEIMRQTAAFYGFSVSQLKSSDVKRGGEGLWKAQQTAIYVARELGYKKKEIARYFVSKTIAREALMPDVDSGKTLIQNIVRELTAVLPAADSWRQDIKELKERLNGFRRREDVVVLPAPVAGMAAVPA